MSQDAFENFRRITIIQNRRRLAVLKEFRQHVIDYYKHSTLYSYDLSRRETGASQEARLKINRLMKKTHGIVMAAEVTPIVLWRAAPVAGGYERRIDLLHNICDLSRHEIPHKNAIDFLDRAIGVYESDTIPCWIRTFNPLFYLGLLLDWIARLPFRLLGQIGLNGQALKESRPGMFIGFLIKVITTSAALLALLDRFGYLKAAEPFFRRILSWVGYM